MVRILKVILNVILIIMVGHLMFTTAAKHPKTTCRIAKGFLIYLILCVCVAVFCVLDDYFTQDPNVIPDPNIIPDPNLHLITYGNYRGLALTFIISSLIIFFCVRIIKRINKFQRKYLSPEQIQSIK